MGVIELIAERAKAIEPSATVALPDRARALRAAGVDVIDLSEGEPYFGTPKNQGSNEKGPR